MTLRARIDAEDDVAAVQIQEVVAKRTNGPCHRSFDEPIPRTLEFYAAALNRPQVDEVVEVERKTGHR